ncbi:hypothetical protein, conserved [Cyanidioschyzon merolae strain 10D]|uniref:Methyltransferase domain-containing protein n=1 Tax=Cyanidioschyzon merolae (strain NIES-3377 / 10D) TaxID=280699 RepID=M1VB61_CYAM1|nr:hypothetical protein, conserved [Cyanidioschyzon merolae strain 10D]BAM82474.1 hypothetical protein, conserved [Cyanidioschyzon merolae strain 10D]|eukprot:XP_005538510.1 hypothetical protein, conserved [Cyanidioschyzon merolae strain 10D]
MQLPETPMWQQVLQRVLTELETLRIVHTCRSASLYEDDRIWTLIPAHFREQISDSTSAVLQQEGAALADALLVPFVHTPESTTFLEQKDDLKTTLELAYQRLPRRKALQVRKLAPRMGQLLDQLVCFADHNEEHLQLVEVGCGRGLVSQTLSVALGAQRGRHCLDILGIEQDPRLCALFRRRWARAPQQVEAARCAVRHARIECAADIARHACLARELCDNVTHRSVILALHGCGALSAYALRTLDSERCTLQPEAVICIGCCYHKLRCRDAVAELVPDEAACVEFPLSRWLSQLEGFTFSALAYGGDALMNRSSLYLASTDATALRNPNAMHAQKILRQHHYRAMLQVVLSSLATAGDAELRRRAQMLLEAERDPRWALLRRMGKRIDQFNDFAAYARDGLECLQLPFDPELVQEIAAKYDTPLHRHRCFVFWTLCGRLAPLLEALVLLDRVVYAQECGYHAWIEAAFPAEASPRNRAIIAVRRQVADRCARAA